MRFRVRNTYYLKISRGDVLPLYLYLDERHVDWMSERTLHYVISDLRPLVGQKLELERNVHYGPGSSTKKGTVDVHRGEYYQLAYFLRKVVPHAVVMKTRNFVMVNNPPKIKTAVVNTGDQAARNKGSTAKRTRTGNAYERPSKKGKGKAIEVVPDSEPETIDLSETDEEEVAVESGEPLGSRRSTRNKTSRTNHREDDGSEDDLGDGQDGNTDIEVKEEEPEPTLDLTNEGDVQEPMHTDTLMDEDEEEKKLKPKIRLSFRSLQMRDLCLCVVVEPWPALSSTPAPALNSAPNQARQVSMPPPADIPNRTPRVERAETPLFLPDYDRGRSETPAPMQAPIRFSSVLNDLETIDDADDIGADAYGMMAFSQALNNVSGDRMGAAGEDEDEMDGGALYGDADEHDFVL